MAEQGGVALGNDTLQMLLQSDAVRDKGLEVCGKRGVQLRFADRVQKPVDRIHGATSLQSPHLQATTLIQPPSRSQCHHPLSLGSATFTSRRRTLAGDFRLVLLCHSHLGKRPQEICCMHYVWKSKAGRDRVLPRSHLVTIEN